MTPAGPLAPPSIVWCAEGSAKARNAHIDPNNDILPKRTIVTASNFKILFTD